MRANTLLHERHLLEAIRRGLITHAQAEALLAIARTEPGGAARLPDVGWVGLLQGVIVGGAGFIALIANMDHAWRTPPALEVVRGLFAAAAFFAGGYFLRRYRWAEAPASVALGAAALQLVGVGHGLFREESTAFNNGAMLAGFGMMLVAGVMIWRALRAGPALAAVGAGFAGVLFGILREQHAWARYERDAGSLLLVGVGLLGWSVWQDRATSKAPVDGAFWTHLGAVLSLMLSAAIFVDRQPGTALPYLFLALGVGWLGLVLRRRVLLAGAGVSLTLLPAYALAEARVGDEAVGAGFALGAIATSVAAHFVRKALYANATGEVDERSVWI